MNAQPVSTAPKPFVFVVMPFDPKFNDIYKFGINGAAEDVGAYAERLDEQIFGEGMLERIFNQISQADVIVADMTGRNPNVFYEVGYAHALGKTVILLTQDSKDIPFDLKHHQHTVYKKQIEFLRKALAEKLAWGIAQAKQSSPGTTERLSLRIRGIDIPRSDPGTELPLIDGTFPDEGSDAFLTFQLRNDSFGSFILSITHVYLFCEQASLIAPCETSSWIDPNTTLTSGVYTNVFSGRVLNPVVRIGNVESRTVTPLPSFQASSVDAPDGLTQEFRLAVHYQGIPPGAVEQGAIPLMIKS